MHRRNLVCNWSPKIGGVHNDRLDFNTEYTCHFKEQLMRSKEGKVTLKLKPQTLDVLDRRKLDFFNYRKRNSKNEYLLHHPEDIDYFWKPHPLVGTFMRQKGPSTPIHDLLEHKYQDRWLVERRSAELTKKQKAETQRLTPGKVYETRASMMRNYRVPVQSAPLWQMPKFSNCSRPHLETFRTSQAKDGAFKHHQTDRIARKGVIGQGIYEPAVN